jgi:hypothetical protein
MLFKNLKSDLLAWYVLELQIAFYLWKQNIPTLLSKDKLNIYFSIDLI